MGMSTTAMALCVNCGFIGASLWINGNGPYCGKCADQASGRPSTTTFEWPPSPPDRDEKVKKLAEALRAVLVMWDCGECPRKLDDALTWIDNDRKAKKMADAALAEVDAEGEK
jgi:hypothetical protein